MLKSLGISCICCVLMTACNPSSHQDFTHEADRVCRSLIDDLKQIQHSQDLSAVSGRLEKDFSRLVDVIIEARKVQTEDPDAFSQEILECPSSEILKHELIRVYGIEGGRAAIEKAQREPLSRLDRFELMTRRKLNPTMK